MTDDIRPGCANDHDALTRVWEAIPNPRVGPVWEQVAEIVAERDALREELRKAHADHDYDLKRLEAELRKAREEARSDCIRAFGETVKMLAERYGVTLTDDYDLILHLERQRAWSERTFGPGVRTAAVIDHIRKELREIEAAPTDIEEWTDLILLALDGAWRSGASPDLIAQAIVAKQAKNESRSWPDWRTAAPDKAIEHEREAAGKSEGAQACDKCGQPLANHTGKTGFDSAGRVTCYVVTPEDAKGEEPR